MQAAYLDAILDSSFKWQAASRVPSALWWETPALFEVYLETLKGTGASMLVASLSAFGEGRQELIQ